MSETKARGCLAHPSLDWSAGLIVATAQPHLYTSFDLPIYPLGD